MISHKFFFACLILSILPLVVHSAGSATMSREVLMEINAARTDPAAYASHLRKFRTSFSGTAYRLKGDTYVQTEEGVSAVDEAILFLSTQKPRRAVTWSPGLAAAAGELVTETGAMGGIGHKGRKSGGPRERTERHGAWSGQIGEVIGYGPTEARLMVMQLIIDDGVTDRGHRKNIFNPSFRRGGAACGNHSVFGTMCVVDFATVFRERNETP